MKLTFTDNYIPHKDYKETPIEIKSKCVVTNYDPQSKDKYGAGDLLFSVDGGSATVKTGNDIERNAQKVNFNPRKFSVFTAIAALDGDASNLTKKDISLAKKYFNEQGDDWQKLSEAGVTKVKYDSHAGVATILMGDDELLRIDFRTWWERIGWEKDSSKLAMQSITQVEETVAHSEEEEKVEEPKKTEVEKPAIAFYDAAIDKVLNDMNENQPETKQITKEILDDYIAKIAKQTGYPESLIRYIISVEKFNRTAKNIGDGRLTIGFGHTKKTTDSDRLYKKGYEISNEEAFELLKKDINEIIKRYLPKCNWENVPQSIQNVIIDAIYNAGPDITKEMGINDFLQKADEVADMDEDKKYDFYIDAAIKMGMITTTKKHLKAGVMKRGCYRFLYAIQDFPAQKRLDAMKKFNSYYMDTIKLLAKNPSEREMLKGDWIEIQHAAEKELGLYTEEPDIKIYRVKKGEVLWNIAKQFNSSNVPRMVKEIKTRNNLNTDSVYEGQRLEIPIGPVCKQV